MKKKILLYSFYSLFVSFIYCDGSDKLQSYLDYESIVFYKEDERQVAIYDKIQKIPDESDPREIQTELLRISFGPIDGYESESLRVGWNNQNRVLYVEILSDHITTKDKLRIGSSRGEVIEALGIPHLEYDNVIRYQNTDFEVFGILFVIEEGVVVKMISFAFV